ncbi:MAG: ATP-binding cassette domain-containing protein [Syntrophorhabdaceae bacterium]|nr:ATP-binding cassette domain-containing protein [Syntrophorhabdaceae bacterium]
MGLTVKLRKDTGKFLLDVAWEMGNEILVLFGHSGSGKSMTLQLMAGLMEPDEGHISSNGRVFYDTSKGINIKPQERRFGYAFQDRVLFPHMTVRENIFYGLLRSKRDGREEKVRHMLEIFHLEEIENKRPSEISGGQKQRVTLARALIGRPEALLLDEPFSALDNTLRIEMRQLVMRIKKEFDIPIVLVTHDILEAYTMADKVALYVGGLVAQTGTPGEIFYTPSSPDVDFYLALNFPFLANQYQK